ncbi:4827_t:CDS:2 [Cetraspora pellucida]|uniref:4827_t:CDS:1 n=1 Tax=Cetraspora pellucida TaxID=1433469 RepID=A0A9N9F784_9GLOM|nr:4827_t:CDS:2 [Cetraspora pellucida]
MNRTKVTVACQACQKKKVKCTGVAPCTNCNRTGHQCEFTGTAKKRGPRNGTVEVIKSSASRIENVLEKNPSLRPQIEQMMKRSSSVRSSRSPYDVPLNPIMIIDNDPRMDTSRSHTIHNTPRNFPYPTQRGHYSQRKHDRMNLYAYPHDNIELQSPHEIRQEVVRPVPKYPLNMRNQVTNGISDNQFSANTNSSHNINTVAIPQSLPPIATLETSPIVECSPAQLNSPLKPRPLLTGTLSDVSRPRQTNASQLPPLLQSLGEDPMKLPIPWMLQQPKKSMSMPIFGNSAGIQLLLSPAPDLGNPLDNNRHLVQMNPQFPTDCSSITYDVSKKSDKTPSPPMTLPSPPTSSPESMSPKYYVKLIANNPLTPNSSPPSPPISPYVESNSSCQSTHLSYKQVWNNNDLDEYKHNERANIERGGNMDVDHIKLILRDK